MRDVRTVYNVLFQYRKLGESIIEFGAEVAVDRTKGETELERRAVRLAKYLRYYGLACLQANLNFLVEVIAQDMRFLTETAFRTRRYVSCFQSMISNLFIVLFMINC
jgi:hypothetical protein